MRPVTINCRLRPLHVRSCQSQRIAVLSLQAHQLSVISRRAQHIPAGRKGSTIHCADLPAGRKAPILVDVIVKWISFQRSLRAP